MTDDELRDLAAKALTFPSLDAELAFGVLTDALLERGLIPEYAPPRKARRKRERVAAERHYRWHTFSWARQTWPLVEERHRFTDWWHIGTDGYIEASSFFGVDRAVDPTMLAGYRFDSREASSPAAMYEQIKRLYDMNYITQEQALGMLDTPPEASPPAPSVLVDWRLEADPAARHRRPKLGAIPLALRANLNRWER